MKEKYFYVELLGSRQGHDATYSVMFWQKLVSDQIDESTMMEAIDSNSTNRFSWVCRLRMTKLNFYLIIIQKSKRLKTIMHILLTFLLLLESLL